MTYRSVLRERAYGNYGYVTARDAREVGMPSVELGKLHARGGLEKVARGVYRFTDMPVHERGQFAEAVLRVGPDAYLTHDAVLALHGLGLVSPRRIRVGTARRVRATLPDFVEVVRRALPTDALTAYEGIPSTTVAQALIDCRGLVMTDRLREALKDAVAEGLVTRGEAVAVRAALRRPFAEGLVGQHARASAPQRWRRMTVRRRT